MIANWDVGIINLIEKKEIKRKNPEKEENAKKYKYEIEKELNDKC